MLAHLQQSLFLDTIPIVFTTAINAATSLLVETRGWGGQGLLDFLWAIDTGSLHSERWCAGGCFMSCAPAYSLPRPALRTDICAGLPNTP
ncbi:hypothetical protein CALCODRAFT_500192 [Calocera cornea HHB12733]|uniref:Uncharacterized protein n=1 Tax=Calocera cornea HHB12733 TaxID=1353952 RepID=A0A165E603_9BASI|nr:hypothetical protein CALCODRAFT_500192 [Calocera cornea HHB12733]